MAGWNYAYKSIWHDLRSLNRAVHFYLCCQFIGIQFKYLIILFETVRDNYFTWIRKTCQYNFACGSAEIGRTCAPALELARTLFARAAIFARILSAEGHSCAAHRICIGRRTGTRERPGVIRINACAAVLARIGAQFRAYKCGLFRVRCRGRCGLTSCGHCKRDGYRLGLFINRRRVAVLWRTTY